MAIHPVDDRRLEQAIRDLSSLGIVRAPRLARARGRGRQPDLVPPRDLSPAGQVTVHRDLAIISLVGKHMKHNVGMAARMFTALADEGAARARDGSLHGVRGSC